MVDRESIGATLAAAIIQGRSTRLAAQAQINNNTSLAALSDTEVADAVQVYLSVLNELDNQAKGAGL